MWVVLMLVVRMLVVRTLGRPRSGSLRLVVPKLGTPQWGALTLVAPRSEVLIPEVPTIAGAAAAEARTPDAPAVMAPLAPGLESQAPVVQRQAIRRPASMALMPAAPTRVVWAAAKRATAGPACAMAAGAAVTMVWPAEAQPAVPRLAMDPRPEPWSLHRLLPVPVRSAWSQTHQTRVARRQAASTWTTKMQEALRAAPSPALPKPAFRMVLSSALRQVARTTELPTVVLPMLAVAGPISDDQVEPALPLAYRSPLLPGRTARP
jgi:hypothetical protein